MPKYNAALVDWAQQQNVPMIDVQRSFQQLPNTLFSDECHLTTQGYQLMAQLSARPSRQQPRPLAAFGLDRASEPESFPAVG